jgi:CAAX prenyl protease-like protein
MNRAIPFVGPFAAFIILLAMRSAFGWNLQWEYPIVVIIVSALVLLLSRQQLSWRLVRPLNSVFIGVVVFLIWIGPDVLWPGYRHFPLFENSITGSAVSSLPIAARSDYTFLAFRIFGTAVLVPIIEELFWRGWVMRYLINSDFEKVPLGTYSASAFWLTAALFATEHGPYWEVGLIAGAIYNWWILRTRSLMDCMLAHGVTNTCLAIYVLGGSHWAYWL